MLSYEELKNRPRDFLAATGLTPDEFENELLPSFGKAYEQLHPPEHTLQGKARLRRAGGGSKGKLSSMADKLLFILVYQKTNPLQTMQGLHFGLSQGQTNYWIHRLLPVLQQALKELGHAPERVASAVAQSALTHEGGCDLVIDGTERRRQRPQDHEKQKEHYSGKKKAHTDKNILLVNENSRKVVYLSPTVPGKTHDKKAADQVQIAYPANSTLSKDTGFQGYEPEGVLNQQPKKKPKGKELSAEEKWVNGILSSARVVVEHVIAGVKRCRIVKDLLRLTSEAISDLVMEIACGLHNLRVSCRYPLPVFDVFSLDPSL